MKMKKITISSAVIALTLVLGTTAVFATSASPDTDGGNITAEAGAHTTILNEGTAKHGMASGYFRSAAADENGQQTAPREPTRQELLVQYGGCGISFDADGKMLFNGKPVRHFIDESESGTFTFDSTGGGDIIVETQYDKNGRLSGLTDKMYDEYAQWGIEIKDGVYYYKNDRVRIFMDMRADGSFEKFFTDENGKADVRLIRGAGGAVTRLELIGEAEARKLLEDLSDVPDDIVKQETLSANGGTEGKNGSKIARLTEKDLSSELQAIIKSCDSTSWYVIEDSELQYVFYDGLPGDYAFQLEGSALKIVDMGESKGAYVLLAVPKNHNLSITYHETKALIIRKTTKAQTKITGIA